MRIYLLGRPTVEADSRPIRIASHKAKALLWYLACQPNQEFERSHLAALLWPDASEHGGRQSLSTTLNRLRRALPHCSIEADNGRLSWRGGSEVWVDTTRFLQLAANTSDPAALAEAVDLWRGPFLEGYTVPNAEAYEAWQQQEAQRWENRMIQTLTNLVHAHQARGDWAQAIRFARRALMIDALQERLHQALMTCYYLAGDRGAALAQYTICERVLRAQLGVDPDESTRRLRDAIAAGTLPRTPPDQPVRPLQEPGALQVQHENPLVGRQEELTQLQLLLTRGREGTTRNVLIYGEAGRGKSRLVRELLRQVTPDPFATVLRVTCQAAWRSRPLWPVLHALGMPLAPAGPAASSGAVCRMVEERLRTLPGPVLLVVEDIHWADVDTCGLLDQLLHHSAAHHLSLLLTSREWELSPALYLQLRQREAEGRLTWLHLKPLPRTDLARLVRNWLEHADAAFVHLLYEETGGNPLFALSILDAIAGPEPGQLPASPNKMPLPAYLRSLVDNRMRSLSPEGPQLLYALALTPEGIGLHQLKRVTGLGMGAILDGLDELLRSRLVEEDPDSDRIRVPLGFVRRAVAGMLSQSRRRYLLSVLESTPPVHDAVLRP